MIFKVGLAGLVILGLVITSCTASNDGAKKLGLDVAKALKSNDFTSYNSVCVSVMDQKRIIGLSNLSKVEMKHQKSVIFESKEEIARVREIRKNNFNDIASIDEWEEAVVSRVIFGKRTSFQGLLGYESIIVKFKQKKLPDLEIEKVIRIKEDWKIMKNDALTFRSRI